MTPLCPCHQEDSCQEAFWHPVVTSQVSQTPAVPAHMMQQDLRGFGSSWFFLLEGTWPWSSRCQCFKRNQSGSSGSESLTLPVCDTGDVRPPSGDRQRRMQPKISVWGAAHHLYPGISSQCLHSQEAEHCHSSQPHWETHVCGAQHCSLCKILPNSTSFRQNYSLFQNITLSMTRSTKIFWLGSQPASTAPLRRNHYSSQQRTYWPKQLWQLFYHFILCKETLPNTDLWWQEDC